MPLNATLITDAVPLADVAKTTKSTVAQLEQECRALLIFVGVDWANRPAISTADAHSLVTGEGRRRHDHDTAWQQYQNEADAWVRARDGAYRVAAGIASRRATLEFKSPGEQQRLGREAGEEAARKYEEENPAPVCRTGPCPPPWRSPATAARATSSAAPSTSWRVWRERGTGRHRTAQHLPPGMGRPQGVDVLRRTRRLGARTGQASPAPRRVPPPPGRGPRRTHPRRALHPRNQAPRTRRRTRPAMTTGTAGCKSAGQPRESPPNEASFFRDQD